MKVKLFFLLVVFLALSLFGAVANPTHNDEPDQRQPEQIEDNNRIKPKDVFNLIVPLLMDQMKPKPLPIKPAKIKILPKELAVEQGRIAIFIAEIVNGRGNHLITWRGPDGEVGNGSSFSVITNRLQADKIYTVYVELDHGEARNRATLQVYAPAPPEIKYKISLKAVPSTISPGQVTRLQVSVFPKPRSSAWYYFQFGDGTSDSGVEDQSFINHLYTREGTYSASVMVTINDERTNTAFADIYVQRPPEPKPLPPTYKLFLDRVPAVITEGESVSFNAYVKPYSANVRYRFNFRNGEITNWGSQNKYLRNYYQKGDYYPFVEAQVGGQYIGKKTRKVKVKKTYVPPPSDKPTSHNLHLQAVPHVGTVGEEITFQATLSLSSDVAQYQFHFGDDVFTDWVDQSSSMHSYKSDGIYSPYVKVKVKGKILEKRIEIEIKSSPQVINTKKPNESDWPFLLLGFMGLFLIYSVFNVFKSLVKENSSKSEDSKSEQYKQFKLRANREEIGFHKIEMEPINSYLEIRFRIIKDAGEHTFFLAQNERKSHE